MDINLMYNRISKRSDLVKRLTHLTRGNTDDEAFDVLWKILNEKKLMGSGNGGFIVGSNRAVCFQEIPLYSIVENLLFEDSLKGNRYSWFGIRVNKPKMICKGARPVIYGKTEELKSILPEDEYWRIVRMDYDDLENIVDWSHEREWRILGDYSFEYDDIEILVKKDKYYKKFVEKCLREGKEDLLKSVHGIIPLNSVIS